MFWNLLLVAVSLVISYLFRQKPDQPKAGTLEDFDIPKVTEGDEIGKVYGTVWSRTPQVHWYGDFRSKAIKQKGGKK